VKVKFLTGVRQQRRRDGTVQHSATAITAKSRDGQETSSQQQGDTVETFNLM